MRARRTLAAKLRDGLFGLPPVVRSLRSVSFSQYGEDKLLDFFWPERSGFYIDVGAYHPWKESNTFKLYLRGWAGLTIEPNPDMAPLFRRMRPRDTHLALGVARRNASLTYYRFSNPHYNTFDPERARRFRDRMSCEQTEVACAPLSEIVSRHCADVPLDLLSVDCEGHDHEALTTLDWERTRPTVVIVEDFDLFRANRTCGGDSPIRSLLCGLDYELVAQGGFSFLYVDGRAVGAPPRSSGFRLDRAQLAPIRR
jgi:FkbM family methyltransferase